MIKIFNCLNIKLIYYETLKQLKQMEFLKNATISVPLKYLSNFWRSLEMQLVIGE